jgi:signal transduction histidine kinase
VERGTATAGSAAAALARARAWSTRNPLVADAALAAALWLVSVPLASADARARDWVVATLLTAPLLLRRRAPLPVFCAIALIAFAQWLAAVDLQVGDASVLFALYAVVAFERRWWTGAAAFAVGLLGALLASVRYTEGQAWFAFLSLAAFVVSAAALGIWGRTRRERIAELEERARRLERERDQQVALAAAAERARIARELHDVVAHNLTVMVALADGARLAAPVDPERADAAMRDVSSTGREALGEMRRLLGVLRDRPAEPAGAPLAPQPGLDQLDALLDQVRRTGLDATLTRSGEPRPLSSGAELTLYRVVQEALTNTLKHARGASRAAVRIAYEPDALALEVTDDGDSDGHRWPGAGGRAARSAGGAPDGGGRGLAGMRERLAAFGADVEAGPRPGGGWQVRTRLRLDGGGPA